MICNICPRKCGANRDTGFGICGVGNTARIARYAPHFWEEPCVSGEKGSGAVFFSGCALACVYCQNEPVSRLGVGADITPERLRQIYFELIGMGVHNINLVTPTQFLLPIIESLKGGLPVPVVWNTGGYERLEAVRALDGYVSVFMPDMKYIDEGLAESLSGCPDYPGAAKKAIVQMYRQTGPYVLDEAGMIKSGVIIRHLMLPGQIENTLDVIDWVADTFPKRAVMFHLMSQYTPCGRAKDMPELGRKIDADEYERARSYLMTSPIEDGYIQDMASAGEEYIPAFQGEPVIRGNDRYGH